MATVNFIRYKSQSKTALCKVTQYVEREDKTMEDGERQLVSGQNCTPRSAYREFLTTREMYHKESPIWFYHYTQSFSPKENITPRQAHELAKEFAARAWPDSEVLISTHLDAAHIHSHFIVNAVCHETGKMLRQGPETLKHLRKISDELMERNRPASAMQSTAPTAEPSITVLCPMPVELEKLTRQLEQLENRCAWQEKYLKELSETRYSYPTRTQVEELLKSVQHLETMTEQAGKKKEKHFSLPRFRLPRLYLPEWEWPTVLTVVWMLAALLLLWFSSVDGWNKLSLTLQ